MRRDLERVEAERDCARDECQKCVQMLAVLWLAAICYTADTAPVQRVTRVHQHISGLTLQSVTWRTDTAPSGEKRTSRCEMYRCVPHDHMRWLPCMVRVAQVLRACLTIA